MTQNPCTPEFPVLPPHGWTRAVEMDVTAQIGAAGMGEVYCARDTKLDRDVAWGDVPASPGVYVIYENDEVIYVGMSGRNGKGNLRNRLRDHCSGKSSTCSRSICSWPASSSFPASESRIRGTPRLPAIDTSSRHCQLDERSA